jgi:hypothetical protein
MLGLRPSRVAGRLTISIPATDEKAPKYAFFVILSP